MRVHVLPNRNELGEKAGAAVAGEIKRLLVLKGRAVGLFAAAPSQVETLARLTTQKELDWGRVTVFHLDEWAGMSDEQPQSFRRFLREHLVNKVRPRVFHELRGDAEDLEEECRRYARLLEAEPPDFALIGIGENGHLAFNDPPVADFHDRLAVKVVELDERCRKQQVHDGLFGSIDDVPKKALTVTIPTILRVPKIFVAVPGSRKREAVEATLRGPVTTECPASVLQRHPAVELFLDRDSAPPGWPEESEVGE